MDCIHKSQCNLNLTIVAYVLTLKIFINTIYILCIINDIITYIKHGNQNKTLFYKKLDNRLTRQKFV
jgi:hypothetical protein